MKTQISKNTFSTDHRYSGIYQQMGRMITDADWNELSDLVQHQLFDALEDVVGSGAPRNRGMVIPTGPDSYGLRWGHLYVQGVHARVVPIPSVTTPAFDFAQQADFPSAPVLTAGRHRLYADVWERSVTALEEPSLLDPGLKGADTCTRKQIMAQIKACDTSIAPDDIQNNPAINPSVGNIPVNLSVRQGQTTPDPCDPCANELALQDSVGNYLFRLEVHHVAWSNDPVPRMTEIVLKWSSENGAEQYRVGQVPPGFASSKWCYEFFSGPDETNEALNMTTEKHIGHHLLSGFSPERGVLFDGYPTAAEPADLPLVRRWDGFVHLTRSSGDWAVSRGADRNRAISDTYADTDHAFIDLSGAIRINLNALVLSVELNDKVAVAGDFWQVAVRDAIHDSGSILLEESLPQGIQHRYFVLGTIDVDDAGAIVQFDPERQAICKPFDFPKLTDIRAKDVCYKNDVCDMPEVRTVQDAIDYLCRERDLRWHNKHLHGMGVVCGLKVQCGPDTAPTDELEAPRRRSVVVTDGYAIGCEGDDIVLDLPRTKDIMDAIDELQDSTDVNILDEDGNGSVCLYIDLDVSGEPVLRVTHEDPSQAKPNWLDGTIWMDFYESCIQDLLEEIKKVLGALDIDDIDAAESENGELISAQRKKYVTLVNLIFHLFYRPHGQYVFTSRKEHAILRDLYLKLRDLMQSKTFCGMFKGQDFPAYPFAKGFNATTYFGKHHHERILAHPEGRYVFTYQSADTTINIYDTQTQTLVAETEVPSGQGGAVTALCLSNDGKLLYAAVDLNGTDAILSRARLENSKPVWETSAVLCNVTVADLRFSPGFNQTLFLVGLNAGLYVLDTEKIFTNEKIVPSPSIEFNAVGQVAYDFDNDTLFATAASMDDEAPEYYDRIAYIRLTEARNNLDASPILANTFPLIDEDGQQAYGEDDIAVSQSGNRDEAYQGNQVYIVVDGSNQNKSIWCYPAVFETDVPMPLSRYSQLPDTEIRLTYHHQIDRLLVSLQDEFRLQMFEGVTLTVERIPVQLMPTDLAVNQKTGDVYTLNYFSNTVSAIGANELNFSNSQLQQLSNYRLAVLMAFLALFGNLLQNLKDCFCHLLLMKCPDCSETDKVWLAKINMQGNEVYKICNIGKRKELWTIPKVKYWLSMVPVLPLIKRGVSNFCCSIIPNIFSEQLSKYQASTRVIAPFKGKSYKQGVRRAKKTDTKVLWRENTQDAVVVGKLGRDRLLHDRNTSNKASASKQQYRNMKTDDAKLMLENKGMSVNVKEYKTAQADEALAQYRSTPKSIPKGSHVTLYQQKGKVLFYTLDKQTDHVVLDDEKLAALEARKQALSDMEAIHLDLARSENRKLALEKFHSVRYQITEMNTAKARAEEDVAALKEQIQQLKTEREKTRADLQSMEAGLSTLSTNLNRIKLDVTKERPIKEISEVDDETNLQLKSEGILTINDLATADTARLTQSGLDEAKARVIIKRAQDRLNLLQ